MNRFITPCSVIDIQSKLLYELHRTCGMSKDEVDSVVKKTDLLEFIRSHIDEFKEKDIYTILQVVRTHLNELGYKTKLSIV